MFESSDRNLQIGMLALKLGLLSQRDLLSALQIWSQDSSETLDGVMLRHGFIEQAGFELLQSSLDASANADDNTAAGVGTEDLDILLTQVEELGDPNLTASIHSLISHSAAEQTLASRDVPHQTLLDRDSANSAEGTEKGTAKKDQSSLRTSSPPRYHVIKPHARGGLGEVSLALDAELNRQVALKQIQSHYADDANARSRFLLEGEVTGGLEHPGVVPVYGMGSYADGRPYYAMRFIRGDSLRDAAREYHARRRKSEEQKTPDNRLELRKLLDRFLDVCQTIEYAHSRGVLHRDLKPENIMLGPYGETLVVDWGLAKVAGRDVETADFPEPQLQPSSGSGSAPTRMGSVVGTPNYMSPEQAAGSVDKIGPQSDVYSLGATLYFVLTGQTAFETKRDSKNHTDIAAILRRVQFGDFPHPRQINRQIPKPLEAICLKAMARDPEARYPSPAALSEDLERYLADEPVIAHTDSLATKLRRWIRRHQTVATTVAAVVLLATVGLLVFSALLGAKQRELAKSNTELQIAEGEARKSADMAEQRRQEAENQRIAAEEATARAVESSAITLAYSTFLTDQILATARPKGVGGGLGINVTVQEALLAAEGKIDEVFGNTPQGEISARAGLGQTWYQLGDYRRAHVHQARVLELLDQTGTINSQYYVHLDSLAATLKRLGEVDEAIRIGTIVLEKLTELKGKDDPDTLVALNNLALSYQWKGDIARATEMLEDLYQRSVATLGVDHLDTLNVANNLAEALSQQDSKQQERSTALLEMVVEKRRALLGDANPETSLALNNLAAMYEAKGEMERAVQMLESAMAEMSQSLGNDHPSTLMIRTNLGKAMADSGRGEEGLEVLQAAWNDSIVKLGEEHPDTLNALDVYCYYLWELRSSDLAIPLYEQVLASRENVLGESAEDTLVTMNNLALAYDESGETEKAGELLKRSLRLRRENFAARDPRVLSAIDNYAMSLVSIEDFENAIPLVIERAEAVLAVSGPNAPDTWTAFDRLANLYFMAHEFDQSIATFERLLALKENTLSELDPQILNIRRMIAVTHGRAGRNEQSITLFNELIDLQQRVIEQSPDDPQRNSERSILRGMMADVAMAENVIGKFSDAKQHAEQSVALAKELLPGDWRVANAQSVLGDSLAGLGEFAEAENVLLAAHHDLLSGVADLPYLAIREFVNMSFDRIIRLYESQLDSAKIEQWKQAKEDYNTR